MVFSYILITEQPPCQELDRDEAWIGIFCFGHGLVVKPHGSFNGNFHLISKCLARFGSILPGIPLFLIVVILWTRKSWTCQHLSSSGHDGRGEKFTSPCEEIEALARSRDSDKVRLSNSLRTNPVSTTNPDSTTKVQQPNGQQFAEKIPLQQQNQIC